MNYHTDEEGAAEFHQNVAAAVPAEEKVAAYYRSKSFTVVNQGSSKKTDLVLTTADGQSTLLEVKDNWKDITETTVVIENNSARKPGDIWSNDGWIYTSNCAFIGFVNSDTNKMLLAPFKLLQAAFKEVIKIPLEGEPGLLQYQHTPQTSKDEKGKVWHSSYFRILIDDLKQFGAKFKVVELTVPPVSVAPIIEPLPEAAEIIDDHIEDATKFHDERSKWLENLNDGFLDEKSVKAMIQKFS